MGLLVNDDFAAARYLIKVEGTKLKDDITQYVDNVVYEEGEDVASKIELDVLNPGFRFCDQKVFAEGNAVDLWLGYVAHKLHFQNRGIIMKPNPGFPRSGIPRMKVVAHGAERKLMTADPKGKTFKKLTDSEIFEKVVKEGDIQPFTIATKGPKTRTRKKGVSNWKFIQRLARINGYEISVRYDPIAGLYMGYFGPPEDEEEQADKFKLIYGTGDPDSTLVEFWPDFSLPSQETRVEVAYTDPKTRKTHRLIVEIDDKKAEKTLFVGGQKDTIKKPVKNGPSVLFTVFGQSEEVIADRVFRTPADAKRFAAAWFARREKEFIFGRGVASPGIPSLRRRQVHEFKLPGPRLSGDWIITSVRQMMGQGQFYETEFTATKKVLDSKVGAPGNVAGVTKEDSDQ